MSGRFFIGRTKELERLEHFTLRPGQAVHRPRLAHIWGTEGSGKSSLVQKFISLLPEESVPVISFCPSAEDLTSTNEITFYNEMFASAETNIGDLLPWIEQLKNTFYQPEEGAQQSLDYFWAQRFLSTVDTMAKESIMDLKGLCLVFAMDDIARLPLNLRIGFCSFINRICETLDPAYPLSVITTGTSDLNAIPDIPSFWQHSIAEGLRIHLENLTREETFSLLESKDLDSNLISKIYNQTQGNPGQIMLTLEDQNLQSINFEECYTRGKNMMYQFNNFQKRWIQWAAIIRQCNDETVSMITEGQEIVECMNWVRKNYPVVFEREGTDYVLKSDYRRAILAYVQRNEPELFREINEIVLKLTGVKHTVPNFQHRHLLSKLADLNYFDLNLLKKVFDEETYRAMLSLIESKPIFFRQELDSYRLASNIRATIAIYNSLHKNTERDKFLYRVNTLWNEKQKLINEQLIKSEKTLHEFEERNRSLTQSLGKVEEEIKNLKNSKKQVVQTISASHVQPQKRFSIVGAVTLQATGIAILYVNTLVMDRMSLSYLLLSGICIVGGIILGVKGPAQTSAVTAVGHQASVKSENYDHIIHNLEIDLINLLNQKEQAQRKIESDKLNILNLQASRNHTYISNSDT